MRKLILAVVFGLVLVGCCEVKADQTCDQTVCVSTFAVGDIIEEDGSHYVIRELANEIVATKNTYFMTFVQLHPAKGHHNFEMLMVDKSNKVIKVVNHGPIDIYSTSHVHSLYTVWDLDMSSVNDYFYLMVVDTFKGRRFTVFTSKLDVSKQ